MKATTLIITLLLLSCCIVANCYYNEADRLHELIESQTLLKSIREETWNLLSTQNTPIYVGSQVGLMEADKIDALPGQPNVNFDQYGGYVTVDSSTGRALFYYFVESPQDASTKPLVLWLNGGPGCSSLGAGAMMELGPFRVYRDGRTLYTNEYAWNNVANVIFLESPAGVGFSYSNTSSDYKLSGDKRTADDSYTFLVNWIERFPQYKNRDFYITGESYAGHYIPELASTILKNNEIADNTVINLKGIAIGNGYMDRDINTKAVFDYYWTHALNSDEAYKEIQAKCSFANQNYSIDCITALRSASAELGLINRYNIYALHCRGATGSIKSVKEFDPCWGSYTDTYLNHPEVQKALHANLTGLQYPWSLCSSVVGQRYWNDAPATLLPTIQYLIESGLRVWLYSGDLDAVCPVTSTRGCINMLGLPVESVWRPWYISNEVGGYVVGYKGLTFVTVRGAGHLVPSFQPERALIMISSFLEGQLPPSA